MKNFSQREMVKVKKLVRLLPSIESTLKEFEEEKEMKKKAEEFLRRLRLECPIKEKPSPIIFKILFAMALIILWPVLTILDLISRFSRKIRE